MKKRSIDVVAYDATWPTKFNEEKLLLTTALGELALGIEHIGSTAVKGLSAKPIIDILLEVSCLDALDERNNHLEALGYKVKGENGIEGRRYFQKGGNDRSHHIHAFLSGDNNLTRHRAFRDYLIAHPAISKQYAEVKQYAAKNCNNSSVLYMSLKNDFIQVHEPLAIAWQKNCQSKDIVN